jgi:hypothetical protein
MNESTKPPEPNEEAFPPLADDSSMPTTDETPNPAEVKEAATPSASTGGITSAEATPTKDPWAEGEPPATPEPTGVPVMVVVFIFAVAAAVIVFLVSHARSLGARIDQVTLESEQAKAQAGLLQTQLDQLSLAAKANTTGLLIVSAVYGSGGTFRDVTDRVNTLLHESDAEFYSKPEWLHDDPTPGYNKELVIVYKYQGQRHIFMTGEGGKVSVTTLLDEAKK